eukprot:657905-Rhodomonas_salina.1
MPSRSAASTSDSPASARMVSALTSTETALRRTRSPPAAFFVRGTMRMIRGSAGACAVAAEVDGRFASLSSVSRGLRADGGSGAS